MVTGMRGDRARSELAGTRFADVRWVAETGSTNRDLLDLAASGDAPAPEGVVLVADHQTAGRGRLDRSWVAPPDSSLLMSVLFRPGQSSACGVEAPTDAHLLSTAVGVSAVEACRMVCGAKPELKWPNDLVVGPRKLGGILAESTLHDGALDAVVVGIGLNVNWPRGSAESEGAGGVPLEVLDIATALNHIAGHLVDREHLLIVLLQRLEHWSCMPADRLMQRARELSATLGSRVSVDLGTEKLVGTAVEIRDSGGLVVELDGDADGGQRREVVVGDVVHLRPA